MSKEDLICRIGEYLGNGGLFNPEMMDAGVVRELLLDVRAFLIGEELELEEDGMVSELLGAGVLFLNQREYLQEGGYAVVGGKTLVLYLNCSDVFAWGYADAEDVLMEEVEKLYRYWKVDRVWGSTKYIIEKRKRMPIVSVIERMRVAGVWDENYELYRV
jgi:hypothetical protein